MDPRREGRAQEEHKGSDRLAAAAHQDSQGTDTHTGVAGGETSEVQPKLQKVGEQEAQDELNSWRVTMIVDWCGLCVDWEITIPSNK